VQVVVEHLGDLVDLWVTVNEPVLWATMSYWRKRWPPQQSSWFEFDQVVRNFGLAHRKAYRVIHRQYPDAQVGVAKHMISYKPIKDNWLDSQACQLANYWFNHRFYRLLGDKFDFMGVNYYFQRQVGVGIKPPFVKQTEEADRKSDIDWPIVPEGLVDVLRDVKKYNKPVYVTENGLADKDDKLRADFIRDHLRSVEQAQREGVDVRGYLHWSLLDNFEWDMGFGPRFGLIEVDYKTMERKIRPSALVYKAIIEQSQQA